MEIRIPLAAGDYDQLPHWPQISLAQGRDLMFVAAAARCRAAAKSATSTTPIVFHGVSDPVAVGGRQSRPRAATQGFSGMTPS